MSTKFLSPGWRMPKNANQSKSSNYSLDFDGNDAIEIPQTTATDITGSNTIAMWVKRSTSGSNQNLVNKRGASGTQYAFFIETTNFLGFDDGTGAKAYGNTVIPTNAWTHVAVVVESSGCTFYVNGVPDGGVSSGISVGANTHTTYIGKKYTSTFYLNGKLSQVCFFDYALSESQVTTLWGGGTEVSNPMALPSPPIAYYPLGTSAWNGEYLAENNAIGDYVFKIQSGDKIDTGIINLGYQFTVSFWFQRTVTGEYRLLNLTDSAGTASAKYLVDIVYPGSNQVFSHITDTSGFQSIVDSNIPLNSWIHCAYTRNARDSNVYLSYNGAFNQNSGANSMQFPSGQETTNTYIAGLIQSIPGDGFLSNVNYFTSILTLSEIETLYNYGSPIQTLANIPQSSNLKAWYKLDATEIYNSTSTEWSVDNNQNPSAYPSSLDFSGTDQYISCSSSSVFQNTSNFSVSFWVNMDDYSGGGCFLMSANAGSSIFHIYAYGGNNIQIRLRENNLGNGLISNVDLNNKWSNICLVYDGTKTGNSNRLKFYINKVEQTISFNSDIQSSINISNNFLIGQQSGQSGVYTIDGKLSNVSLFSNSLTDGTGGTLNQIETLYNNGTPLADMSSFSSLVSWWKLNNTTTGIEDSKGSNNGTNNGATEYAGFVNTLAGDSTGMTQSNLVQSDLQTVAPYSKYALAFDGTNDYIDCGATVQQPTTNYSVSCWVKLVSTQLCGIVGNFKTGVSPQVGFVVAVSSGLNFQFSADGGSGGTVTGTTTPNSSTWYNVIGTYDGSLVKIYVNNVLENSVSYSATPGATDQNLVIGRWYGNYDDYYTNGSISNVSIWNTALTSTQVSEIYNEGVPSNLNNHSVYSNLVSWWQLGSNSSWNGNRWIVADEKGTNNGYSQNMSPYMPEGGLTNGVGTTANGVSNGMSEGSLVGDAPYSTANAISSGMPVTARGTDVPS